MSESELQQLVDAAKADAAFWSQFKKVESDETDILARTRNFVEMTRDILDRTFGPSQNFIGQIATVRLRREARLELGLPV